MPPLDYYKLALLAAALLCLIALAFRSSRFSGPLSRALIAAAIFLTLVWNVVLFGLPPFLGTPRNVEISAVRSTPGNSKLLLLLHGWTGSEETWGVLPRLLTEDETLARFDIAVARYPTAVSGEGMTPAVIATRLLAALPAAMRGKKLFLIAHSLGGPVGRDIILQASPGPARISFILAIASPFDGADITELSKELGVAPVTMTALSPGSAAIISQQRDWLAFKRSPEGSAVKDVCIVSTRDAVVAPPSGLSGCTEPRTVSGWGHIDITKPSTRQDSRYRMIRAEIPVTPAE